MNPEAYLEMADTESRHWWFCGRRAILSDFIGKLNLPPNARILEIGCGTGGNLRMLSTHGDVSAMEMDETARSIAMKKTEGRFDIRAGVCPEKIPFANEIFDLICFFDVLEHIDADVDTLIAVKGLLAKNGRVLMTVPAYEWLWGVHDQFLHHKRRYTATTLRQKVIASGLQPVKISYFNTILFPLAAAARCKDRLLGNSTASGTSMPPEPVNRLFCALFRSERVMLGRFNLPFGVSLLALLQADQT